MRKHCRLKIIDVDDTGVRTTHDLRGDISRIEEHLTPAPGFPEFLRWSPIGNLLLSCSDEDSELGRARQEKKIGKFDLIPFFAAGIHICGSPQNKQKRLEKLVLESGISRDEIAVIGDRPSCELGTAAKLGVQVYRMLLLDEHGFPEGKYAHEILVGDHVVVNTWHELMLKHPHLGSSGFYELQRSFQP